MGKLLTILAVLWFVGLLLCAQRVVYWSGEAEGAVLDWYGQDPSDRHTMDEEVLAHQEAGRKVSAWFTGLVLWALLGAVVLILVRRWDRARAEEAEYLAQAGQWADRA